MSIKNTIVFTRPSASVDFPETTDAFRAVCADYYGEGKRVF